MAASTQSGNNTLLTTFMLGAAVGSITAMLFAPMSGRETRTKLKEKAEQAKHKMEEQKEKIASKARSKKEDLKDKLEENKDQLSDSDMMPSEGS